MVNPYHECGERRGRRGEVMWYGKSLSRRWGEGGEVKWYGKSLSRRWGEGRRGEERRSGMVNPYHEDGERRGGERRGEVVT